MKVGTTGNSRNTRSDAESGRKRTRFRPSEARLWRAANPDHRDFRLDSIGPAYQSTVLHEEKDGSYIGRVSKPDKGWTAYFIELTYPSTCKYPLKLTTGVRVVPDSLPFPAPK